MAEKEGFEPPVPFPVQLISSQSHSATLPLLPTKIEEEKLIFITWQALTEAKQRESDQLRLIVRESPCSDN